MSTIAKTRRLRLAAATLLAAAAIIAGCGDDSYMQPTMTRAEAEAHIEKLIHDAFAQLPPGATLIRSWNGGVPCEDIFRGLYGKETVEIHYEIDYSREWPVDEVIPRLVEYWKQQGTTVHRDDRDHPDPTYFVEYDDGFSVGVQAWGDSSWPDFDLVGASPCIWPNGTPDQDHP